MEYGFQPGIENARKAIENCLSTDGLLLPRFMLKRNWDLLGNVNTPLPVVRINWTSSFYYPLDYREGNTTIATTVEEAVQAGAEAVICSLFLEEKDSQKRETDNVSVFSEVVRQKEKLGIPLIGECYVVEHKDLTPKQLNEKVKRVSRVMVELGADMIKTFFTGEDFDQVVVNIPVPVFKTMNPERYTIQGSYEVLGGEIDFTADPSDMEKILQALPVLKTEDRLRTMEEVGKDIPSLL